MASDELQKGWKEAVMAYHETAQSRQLVFGPRYEPVTCSSSKQEFHNYGTGIPQL